MKFDYELLARTYEDVEFYRPFSVRGAASRSPEADKFFALFPNEIEHLQKASESLEKKID